MDILQFLSYPVVAGVSALFGVIVTYAVMKSKYRNMKANRDLHMRAHQNEVKSHDKTREHLRNARGKYKVLLKLVKNKKVEE